ncbi:cytochrome P450 [Streptomyces sp. NPDC020807]|uniref:cytochrome P450 n=1 Tax=Streptomyces sp. NPDC020807 TaxID=3155119 RepID=UPI0033F0E346
MSSRRSPAPWHDGTLGLLTHGYAWLPDLMRRAPDDSAVRTRLLGRPALAMRGPDAVGFFYDERHVVRTDALPGPVLDTLFGRGAVHTLDGEAHRVRKALFTALLTDGAGVAALRGHVVRRWRETAAGRGRGRDDVVLFGATADVLALAVRDWAGLPLSDRATLALGHDCVRMVDGFATPGPRHLRARRARGRQEWALAGLVEDVRRAREEDSSGTALGAVVRHRDLGGDLLDPRTAAVELLNVVRPTVAIAWFVAFAAHAMHRWPEQRERLSADADGSYAVAFAHEVRRFYPFAPFVAGLAARDLTWRGERVPKDGLVILDLYGQDHDPALWGDPYRFDPLRFTGPGGLGDLVPQGGGDPARGHRCPGEDVTVTVLAALASELAALTYAVPEQDLSIPLSHVPTLPRSGVVLRLR